MSLNKINEYLNKFKKIIPTESFIKNNTISIIYDVLNIRIKKSEISIQNNIILLKTHPIIKKEILIKKITILNFLNKKTNSAKKIKDIF